MQFLVVLKLFIYLILGILFKRKIKSANQISSYLNNFIIYVCVPSLAIIHIPKTKFNIDLIYPLITPWLIFIVSIPFILLGTKIFKFDKKTTGCLILTSGLGNTSFIGFPVISSLYGTEALKTAIIIDIPGSFTILSTLGIIIATIFSDKNKFSLKELSLNLVTFPPFIAFILAIILNINGFYFNKFIIEILSYFGALITPLALISVGLKLTFNFDKKNILFLSYGLSFKLLLSPLIIFTLFIVFLSKQDQFIQICLMESAMAPMITGSIVAMKYNLNEKLASLMIGIGIPISSLTLTLWYIIMNSYLN